MTNSLKPRLALVSAAKGSREAPARVPEYVRLPILNDDLHVVGHDYVRLGAGLRNYIREWVAEGGAR